LFVLKVYRSPKAVYVLVFNFDFSFLFGTVELLEMLEKTREGRLLEYLLVEGSLLRALLESLKLGRGTLLLARFLVFLLDNGHLQIDVFRALLMVQLKAQNARHLVVEVHYF